MSSELACAIGNGNGRTSDGDIELLRRLFDPQSIAIIGASSDRSKRGFQSIQALLDAGFKGRIHPVNPKGGEILGLHVHSRLTDIRDEIDVALIATPARSVPDVLRDCAGVGVPGAVVLANGFGESGTAGATLEAELRTSVRETGVRVIGPNTSGIFSTESGANLVGLPAVPVGSVSMVTQSGNMLLSLVADNNLHHGPGFDTYIGLGNQADISYAEALDYLADRSTTGAIAVYLEGLPNGREALASLARATRRKPVVILRAGRSDVGRRAVLSHTGSISASDGVAVCVLRQAGGEIVTRSDELGLVTGALAVAAPVPADKGVAILSDGGGHGALVADALSAASVEIASLSTDTRGRLVAVLGSKAALANPVDVAGATDTDPGVFAECARILADDPGVGMILIVGLFGGYHIRFNPALAPLEDQAANEIGSLSESDGIAVVVHSCYSDQNPSSHRILREHGIPVLGSIDHAARATAALVRRGRYLATVDSRSAVGASPTVAPRQASEPRALPEPEARELLRQAGLDAGPWRLATNAADALEAVKAFGQPCALKVISPEVIHKSDVGGVRLSVTPADAESAFAAIEREVRAVVPAASITGVLVAPMAEPGVELFLGATVDPTFGPIVAFGSGGELVELIQDVSFRSAPCTILEAQEMIAETKVNALLDGYRSSDPVNRDSLASLIVQLSEVIAGFPEIRELDLNPVIACGRTLTPVDVRVVVEQTTARAMGQEI